MSYEFRVLRVLVIHAFISIESLGRKAGISNDDAFNAVNNIKKETGNALIVTRSNEGLKIMSTFKAKQVLAEYNSWDDYLDWRKGRKSENAA